MQGRILITGGAGFLARGIYRQASREGWDAQFTCLSRDDSKHVALRARYPEVECIRGDVTADRDWLVDIMTGFDVVIHAAAVKYVDLAEAQAFDTVRVNVDGSRNVALAAIRAGVERVVAISTDKSVEPVNIYGMTKAVMERLMVEADSLGDTRFTVVRYGNVVGSTGSVIPKLVAQARADKVLQITNPAMSRYWMSVDDAVDLIEDALAAAGGCTLIPEMRSMPMGDLAKAICTEYQVIGGWKTVGARPGEKVHEKLMHRSESVRRGLDKVGNYVLYPVGWNVSPAPEMELTSDTAEPLDGNALPAMISDAEDV